jgi:transposase
MIDYETYCQIRDHHHRQGLTIAQTARALALHPQTVAKWVCLDSYRQRQSRARQSKLDPYKGQIVRLLASHPYSGQQILQRLREAGYAGGATILNDYVHQVRPPKRAAFLKLAFAPGECAQLDWGEHGSIAVGDTRRRLSFFVMVLCYSRRLYLEFTVAQTMEHFLACHVHAFEAFGACPARVMVDNLRSAVLQRLRGEAPVFNPRYLDFARHYGFEISACNVGKGNEKGRVENAVGYVKKNFLAGLELTDFSAINAAAQCWQDSVANVRVHGATHRVPIELFEQERTHLRPLNALPYDLARLQTMRASSQFRVTLDTNHYSVPAHYANQRVTLKAYPDRLCVYHREQLIARHTRSYDRHQDIEDADHPKALLEQRRSAREQRLLLRFLALSPNAQAYYEGLQQRRADARAHLRRIVALAEIHSPEAIARAIDDGLAFGAFSSEYITNIVHTRAHAQPVAGPLVLTRAQDLLELEIAPPDLSIYDIDHDIDHDPT